jgi:uncharacterized protein (TIGR02118 family)
MPKGAVAMIRVSILYPNLEGKRFDWDYYLNKHGPMVLARLGDACKGAVVDVGVVGVTPPDQKPTYIAMAHLYFDSIEAWEAATAPHTAEFRADIPNYTDIEPVRQIGEVKLQIGIG